MIGRIAGRTRRGRGAVAAVPPVAGGLPVVISEKVRRNVGTSIAGAAKSVVALRLAAAAIRSL